ncbi:MAG: (2Fe-2S)-binding protein [Planctomycetaceae bacterium]|nr:(2Fe-2S)-binding protein [Planctomycetaceae bacterium]
MELDDEMCLCFHVTRRKIENYIQRTKPQRASQLSECFGAGTGCGWCRPFLHRLWQRAQVPAMEPEGKGVPAPLISTTDGSMSDSPASVSEVGAEQGFDSLTAEEYARQRASYRKQKDEV